MCFLNDSNYEHLANIAHLFLAVASIVVSSSLHQTFSPTNKNATNYLNADPQLASDINTLSKDCLKPWMDPLGYNSSHTPTSATPLNSHAQLPFITLSDYAQDVDVRHVASGKEDDLAIFQSKQSHGDKWTLAHESSDSFGDTLPPLPPRPTQDHIHTQQQQIHPIQLQLEPTSLSSSMIVMNSRPYLPLAPTSIHSSSTKKNNSTGLLKITKNHLEKFFTKSSTNSSSSIVSSISSDHDSFFDGRGSNDAISPRVTLGDSIDFTSMASHSTPSKDTIPIILTNARSFSNEKEPTLAIQKDHVVAPGIAHDKIPPAPKLNGQSQSLNQDTSIEPPLNSESSDSISKPQVMEFEFELNATEASALLVNDVHQTDKTKVQDREPQPQEQQGSTKVRIDPNPLNHQLVHGFENNIDASPSKFPFYDRLWTVLKPFYQKAYVVSGNFQALLFPHD